MTRIALFAGLLCLVSAASAAAQSRTVTNKDLERFKEKRLAAEREYRENYKRLGMPSPEELDRMREQDKIENQKLAERLAAERLERERAEAAANEAAARAAQMNARPVIQVQVPDNNTGLYYGYGGYNSYGHVPRWGGRRYGSTQGYFAGGAFWPTGGGRTRPVFVRPRTVRPPRH